MFLSFNRTKIVGAIFLFILVFFILIAGDRQISEVKSTPVTITGKGGAHSLTDNWFSEYKKTHPNLNIEYQKIGTTAGIKEFIQQTIDFTFSSRLMTAAEIKEAKNNKNRDYK